MFLYASLLIASLVAAVVILWLYRRMSYDAGSVYKTVHPNSFTGQVEDQAERTPADSTSTPWGWKGNETPANVAKTHAAPPTEKPQWGWKGNERGVSEQHPQHGSYAVPAHAGADSRKPGSGWPYREEKQEFTGKAYKVTRKAKPRTTELETADNKPWGW